MRSSDLPLFAWQPPRQTIPFPARSRIGHARKVALQMAKARTQNEATWAYTRACDSFVAQMRKAGIAEHEIERQLADFSRAIHGQCLNEHAAWVPTLPEHASYHRSPDGAA